MITHHVLPAASLIMYILDIQTDHIREQTLGEAVLTHNLNSLLATFIGQFEVTVGLNSEQSVLFHTRHGL